MFDFQNRHQTCQKTVFRQHFAQQTFKQSVFFYISRAINSPQLQHPFNDLKKQGKKVFNKNLRSCQEYSAQNVKRSEGSKAAGELLREKNFIFYSCMKKKYWVLKRQETKF